VARLASISDQAITSRKDYALRLTELSRKKKTQSLVLPIPSNVGEPEEVPLLRDRAKRLVVFGHKNRRALVYYTHAQALDRTCQALGIQEIWDIGAPMDLRLSHINGVPIRQRGIQEAASVSQCLLNSVAGFLGAPQPMYLAKSGIFAAYCAHRLIPIIASGDPVTADGLQPDRHYGMADQLMNEWSLDEAQMIANHAHAWYQTHSISVHAEMYAACFNDIQRSQRVYE